MFYIRRDTLWLPLPRKTLWCKNKNTTLIVALLVCYLYCCAFCCVGHTCAYMHSGLDISPSVFVVSYRKSLQCYCTEVKMDDFDALTSLFNSESSQKQINRCNKIAIIVLLMKSTLEYYKHMHHFSHCIDGTIWWKFGIIFIKMTHIA